ncbi:SRPBCC family protein [Chitiniphilus purpureus]|uniref:SRPBCC family protein n=1 Tax=Chitiniphilus purpureus TaxID=2981137 RepID=A0ABY6DLP3_9NEIS|nr:SRPBCC family protein [Chitiniphilus sp. CD1]UXY14618.1 SRPBCC family protein [Chitiniphilus sp. CD1]
MRFEHLIQINEEGNPLAIALTADQLWQGLVHRARSPQDFMEQVESVRILHQEDGYFEREMLLGRLRVVDHVTLTPGRRVHYDTQPSDEHGGGSLTLTIEEPQPGALFLRVVYETPLTQTPGMGEQDDGYYIDYVKAAYRQNDIDTVRRIRQLAHAGLLG